MPMKKLAYSSPVPISPLEGFALAVFVRSYHRLNREKIGNDIATKNVPGLPLALSSAMVETPEYVTLFAFVRSIIRESDGMNEEDILKTIVNSDNDRVYSWALEHDREIEDTLGFLESLLPVKGEFGFRCVG
jgi:hypothetical protein